MPVNHVKGKALLDSVLSADGKLVVLDVGATWCGPCQMIKPVFAQMAEEYAGAVVFAAVDADESPDVVQAHNVRAFPTFIFFVGGREVDRMQGADQNQLRQKVELHKGLSLIHI